MAGEHTSDGRSDVVGARGGRSSAAAVDSGVYGDVLVSLMGTPSGRVLHGRIRTRWTPTGGRPRRIDWRGGGGPDAAPVGALEP